MAYGLFLASLERRPKVIFFGASVFLNEKNLRFFSLKNTLAPIDFLRKRLLSEAKNSQFHI
jgi:hypothetical protein